jgi:hypothetical protein
MNIPLATICFKDELPKKLEYNKSYIINLDNSQDEEGNDNSGTHWTCLQVNKDKDDRVMPLFFDPYGAPPSESIKDFVKENTGKYLPHTNKDVQSLMNNACGYYCCAFLHFINVWSHRTGNIYDDAENFMNMFDDLNKSIDWKKNEYILKMFFQSSDPKKRKEIGVISNTDDIMGQDTGRGMDIGKV